MVTNVGRSGPILCAKCRCGAVLDLPSAYPTPNLGSGAHAAGIIEAKGAQPSGCSEAPLRVAPKGA